MVEDLLGERLESELTELIEAYSDMIPPDGEWTIPPPDLNSDGTNSALEVRFYPGGEDGSFSIGLGVEKSQIEVTLDYSAIYDVADGSYLDTSANASLLWQPISYHLSFRWDIKPSWRFHPYIGFGAGIGSLRGLLTYEVIAEVYDASTTITISDTDYDEIPLESLEYLEPKITPIILQINFGFNFEISNNLHILLDAGIWDGFLVRGGLSLKI